jgi:hypothetical protein
MKKFPLSNRKYHIPMSRYEGLEEVLYHKFSIHMFTILPNHLSATTRSLNRLIISIFESFTIMETNQYCYSMLQGWMY